MFPMKMIEDYKVLSFYGQPEPLESQVKTLLAEGWTVLGSVTAAYGGPEYGMVYTQVMIKVADK